MGFFFPKEGMSPVGHHSEMQLFLANYNGDVLEEDIFDPKLGKLVKFNAETYKSITSDTRPRLYLLSRKIEKRYSMIHFKQKKTFCVPT